MSGLGRGAPKTITQLMEKFVIRKQLLSVPQEIGRLSFTKSLRSVERVKIQMHMESQGKHCLTWSEFSFCQILSSKYLLQATEAYIIHCWHTFFGIGLQWTFP